MAQPTLVAYSQSDYTDLPIVALTEDTASFTWVNGDVFHVLGATEDDAQTISVPSTGGANLTFSQITANGGSGNTRVYYWRGTATGSGSGTITAAVASNNNTARGISVWQFRDTSGQGTPVTLTGSSAKVIAVTRAQANSHVIANFTDFNADSNVSITLTPATNATSRVAFCQAGHATFFVQSWGDQSAAGGPTNYGFTGGGTVRNNGIAVEIFGSAASPATLSAATPSGTLGTATSATLGATTDQSSGTFYGVVDSAGNISGITAAQVKAGQNNAGAAPVASGNSTVSTSAPSIGVAGLTANTLYSYAVVQNNTNGDSNVLTGTFTTAIASSNPSVRSFGPQGSLKTLLTM